MRGICHAGIQEATGTVCGGKVTRAGGVAGEGGDAAERGGAEVCGPWQGGEGVRGVVMRDTKTSDRPETVGEKEAWLTASKSHFERLEPGEREAVETLIERKPGFS